MSKPDLIRQTLLDHFIETGKPLLISELVTMCKASRQTVKDAIWDRSYDFDFCDIEVWSGSSWNGRYRVCQGAQPSRRYLASIIKAARGA